MNPGDLVRGHGGSIGIVIELVEDPIRNDTTWVRFIDSNGIIDTDDMDNFEVISEPR